MKQHKGEILVTGGAGYIGSHTVVALAEAGYLPVIIDDFRNSEEQTLTALEVLCGFRLALYPVDCNHAGNLEMVFSNHRFAGVIHFAAYKSVNESIQFPEKYMENNVQSLVQLVKMMERFEVRNLIFSSSCTVYGQPDEAEVTETTTWKPATSAYGYTKQIGETFLDYLSKRPDTKLKSVSLRYFNPVGAHSSGLIGELPLGVPANLVPFITQAAAGWLPPLTIYGNNYPTRDGTCIRDFIHVMDLAQAHVQALNFAQKMPPGNAVFNIGTGKGNSVAELIAAFEKTTGVKVPWSFGPRRQGDIVKIFANADKAKNELNWTAQNSLETSMKDAWNWQLTLNKTAKNKLAA